MDPVKFSSEFFAAIHDTTVQRLGYILDRVVKQSGIAEKLYEQSQKAGVVFYRIPLKTSAPTKGFSSDERWKVIVNADIEIDKGYPNQK